MAKCLVSGGCGFVGSHVVDLLIENGHQVTVIDDLSTGKLDNLNPKAQFYNNDICDPSVWGFLDLDYEFVFHLAALARIQPSIDNPVASHEVNLTGTLRALEYCRHNKAKIIFSSSSSIYRGEVLPTNESAELQPKSPYALQKLQAEQYIQMYQYLYGIDYAILRYFNVFGERQILSGAYAAVVGIFLDQKRNGQKLTITNDGEQRRDFTYVKDVAKANLMAMEWTGTVNVGTGKNYSVNQITDFVGGEKEYIGERVGEARNTLADNRQALLMGWQPTVTIEGWINALVR